MAMPTASASTALNSRLRSSRMCSMSGIRPSGFDCRCDVAMREPSMRAPVMVSASLGIVGYGVRSRGSAGLLRARRFLGPGAVDRDRLLLQVTDLLLELVDPVLLDLGSGQGRGRLGLLLLVVAVMVGVQVLHLGLEYAHRPAERARGVRHLLAAEQDDQDDRDDQDLPRTVEQVTKHLSPYSAW